MSPTITRDFHQLMRPSFICQISFHRRFLIDTWCLGSSLWNFYLKIIKQWNTNIQHKGYLFRWDKQWIQQFKIIDDFKNGAFGTALNWHWSSYGQVLNWLRTSFRQLVLDGSGLVGSEPVGTASVSSRPVGSGAVVLDRQAGRLWTSGLWVGEL